MDMGRRCRSLTQRSPATCTCEGVHECGQGAVEHLEERVSAGILLRATQHRVLQDVWDPRAVQGGRSELDAGRQRCSDEDSGAVKKGRCWCVKHVSPSRCQCTHAEMFPPT